MADPTGSGNTPAADEKPQVPAAGEQTPSQPSNEETVILKKSEHDELQKKAAQASEAQKRADILKIQLDRKGKRKVEGTTANFEQKEVIEATTKLTAKILANADYQKVVGGNPILAKVLSSRPWEITDNDEFTDADDLVEQVLTKLDEMVLSSNPATPPAKKEEAKVETPPQPAAANPVPGEDKKDEEKRGGLYTAVDKIADSLKGRVRVK
jgi:hypothetical protein